MNALQKLLMNKLTSEIKGMRVNAIEQKMKVSSIESLLELLSSIDPDDIEAMTVTVAVKQDTKDPTALSLNTVVGLVGTLEAARVMFALMELEVINRGLEETGATCTCPACELRRTTNAEEVTEELLDKLRKAKHH